MMRVPRIITFFALTMMLGAFFWFASVNERAYGQADTVEPAATTYYVSATGVDGGNCSDPATPCRSLQRAINQAASGDTILVATGEYGYAGAAENPCDLYIGMSVVTCVVNKQLTIRGGYSAADWSVATNDPAQTRIDGGGKVRSMYLVSTEVGRAGMAAGLNLENMAIVNGYAIGRPTGGDDQISAFGAGILVDHAGLTLDNVLFESNVVIGGSTQQEHGGAGSGGGLAIRRAAGVAELRNVTFRANRAEGGVGSTRGGYGIGGGLFTYQSTVNGENLQFFDNRATGGSSSGAGRTLYDGESADGQGGAAGFQLGSQVTLHNVLAQNNRVLGGNAAEEAGGAFGGAIVVEGWTDPATISTLYLEDAWIQGNSAQGGDGARGGIAAGGGIESIHSNMYLHRITVVENESRGGNGTRLQGPAGGGGLYLQNIFDLSSKAEIHNSLIAHNRTGAGAGSAVGGGGGGVWLQAIETLISHTTIADNQLLTVPMFGGGLIVLDDGAIGPRPLILRHSIIANHDTGAALHVKPNNRAILERNLFANNSQPTNIAEVGDIGGNQSSLFAPDAFFRNPTPATFDYSIGSGSPAIDGATGSNETQDRLGDPRHATPDIGAFEFQPASMQVQITQVAPSAIRVHWGENPDVRTYEVTVGCPANAKAPTGYVCAQPNSIAGTEEGTLLSGLTNHAVYRVQVDAILNSGEELQSASDGIATDQIIYISTVMN